MSQATIWPPFMGGGFRAERTANQTGIVTATETTIQFTTTGFDDWAAWDTTNFRYNIPFGGLWHFRAQTRWAAASGVGENRILRIRKNAGAIQLANWVSITDAAGGNNDSGPSNQIVGYTNRFVAGDYVYFTVQQNSGANKDLDGSAIVSFAEGFNLGP